MALSDEEIANADLDLQTIGDVATGSASLNGDGTTTNRLGVKIKTLNRIQSDLTAPPYATWGGAGGLSTIVPTIGQAAQVLSTDTGTHVDPSVATAGAAVPNGGFYRGVASPTSGQPNVWLRVGSTMADQAAAAAASAIAAAASVEGLSATIAENADDIARARYSVDKDPPTNINGSYGVLQPTAGIAVVNFRRAVMFPGLAFTDDDLVEGFDVEIVSALAGRTIEFYISNSAGALQWASGALDASAIGEFSFNFDEDGYEPNAGDYPGWWISSNQTSDGIAGRDNQGNAGIGNIIYNEATTQGRLVVGQTYTASTSGWAAATRYLPSLLVRRRTRKELVSTGWANQPNGWVQLDEEGQLPEGIGDSLSDIATALTTVPAPVAPAASQAGRVTAMIGDSVGAGGNHRGTDGTVDHNGYAQQLATYFGWAEHNLSVPSTNIKNFNDNANGERAAALALSAVTLFRIGYTHNEAAMTLGVITDMYPAQNTVYGNYNKALADLMAAFPGATFVLESITNPYPLYPDAYHGPKNWLALQQVDEAKRQIAIAKGIYYLPFRDMVPKPPFLANFQDDGLHPNNRMHDKILFPIAQQFYRQM